MMVIMIARELDVIIAYTNFQEFFMLTDEDLTSPNAVRLSPLIYQGNPVEEWWQFRGYTLGIGTQKSPQAIISKWINNHQQISVMY